MRETVAVLIRLPEEMGDLPTLVRSYATYDAALAAKAVVEDYLNAADAPPQPGPAPATYTVLSLSNGQVRYLVSDAQDVMWTQEQARAAHPLLWALHDASHAAYRWWTEANPVDRGAPFWSRYTVESVEYTDR